ncbi:hypothetical protein B0H13DRAFT_1929590 [Mycena leptocephala]|nr:hypothetical protein B0H13DRAFT_1929590 [Mycena leptocephala]
MTPAQHRLKPTRAEIVDRQRVKKRARDRRIRAQTREEQRISSGSRLKKVSQTRLRQSKPIVLGSSLEEYRLPVASSGWMGVRQDEPKAGEVDIDELIATDPEMHLLDWQGVPTPVLDRERRVLLVLGGFPLGAVNWERDVAEAAATSMAAAAAEIYTEPKWRRKLAADAANAPRRGPHASKHVGPSMGGGQEYPQNLLHSAVNAAVFARLFGEESLRRIAGWTNALFMAFAPDLHKYYGATLDELFCWDALQSRANHLLRNFGAATSVFSTATFNFGPRTVTLPHIDFGNLAWGWCAITALGWFNPDRGGHLILWDLKLIIRFPPGSTILIPSAILRHSNTKIQQGEYRYSFTQFTPAGIFRWVYNGFRTDRDINESKQTTERVKERRRRERQARWQEGVRMYRTWP